MTVYTIAFLEFTDLEAYRRYQRAFPAVLARSSGKVLAADEKPLVLEGSYSPDKVVLMSFPDEQAARRFMEDPAYVEIAKDRKAGANASIVMVRGLGRSQ